MEHNVCPNSHKMKKQNCEILIKYFAWKNYLGQLTKGSNYLEGSYPWVIIRGTIIQAPIVRRQLSWVWGEIIRVAIVRGSINLEGNFPGGKLSSGKLSGSKYPGAFIRGVIIRRAIALEPKQYSILFIVSLRIMRINNCLPYPKVSK